MRIVHNCTSGHGHQIRHITWIHVWIQSESRNIYHIVLILIVKKILSQGSEKCLFHWPICQEAWRPSQSFSPPPASPPPPPHLPTLDAPGRAPAPPPPHLLPPGDAQVRGRHFSPPPRPHRHPRRQVRPSRDCCRHLQVGKALRASAYITHSKYHPGCSIKATIYV